MNRRELMAGLAAASALSANAEADKQRMPNTYLELKVWQLHNSREDQAARLAEYLEAGLMAGLKRSGSSLIGAFGDVIGADSPRYVSLSEFSSLAAFQRAVEYLASDEAHQRELNKLSASSQFPFVRVESSLLRSFDAFPAAASAPSDSASHGKEPAHPRIFELRTYESPSYSTLARKVAMFNQGESQIFERLQMRPVFFGETIAGPRQPNLTYMLSFDDLAARESLWHEFGSDPAWKALSSKPELKDSEVVTNISNAILRPLAFSPIR